ncbi:DUF6894 family protein [Sphingomonas faeni]|uniref:DUF6894 family protein n=1 Tax=Sphingomonas faeni TaxID=185950 RepID=UPI00278AFF7D|nr:hypothetical protein [Sphingomonas faeni]MDQ0840150.1 hypothetical protein [Sphingomonas faeni]
MPRFFLHIDDGAQRIEDEEGSDLPDLAAAREEALSAARQLWAAAILRQQDIGARRFLIAGDDGNVTHVVKMDDALPQNLLHRLRAI